VLVLSAALAALAGCGGQASRPEPRLAQRDAARLVALARRVARDAPSDGCAARRDVAALSSQAHALVAAGRVPLRLRAPLLAGVAAVAADAPACAPPAPAPAPTPAPAATAPPAKARGHEKPGHEQRPHRHPDHGHGHGHGHDHGD
jgi:hypothetical protein